MNKKPTKMARIGPRQFESQPTPRDAPAFPTAWPKPANDRPVAHKAKSRTDALFTVANALPVIPPFRIRRIEKP